MRRKLYFLFVFLFFFLYLSNCGRQSNSQAQGGTAKEGRFDMGQTRKPAVAGQFYPSDSMELSRELTGYFKNAKKEPIPGKIVGLISPHAGYMYSGQVAAYAYKLLEGFSYETVVVISPSHVAYFPGASVYNGGAYQTPLGTIPIDTTLAGEIASVNERVFLSNQGHAFVGQRGEHAIEVELPFLQLVLGKFKLVPIVIGDQDWATCEALAEALVKSIKGKSVLMVASSDLSHYHPYDQAEKLDSVVIKHVNAFDPEGLFSDLSAGACEACGGSPITALLLAAKGLGADKAKVVKYANSGDVTGDKSAVVGYMAAVVYDSKSKSSGSDKKETEKGSADMGLSAKDKATLMNIARTTIENCVKGEKVPDFDVDSPILKEKRGAFVTIHEHGQLRGCIGYIEAIKPLYLTIREMAQAAALNDPRFNPVSPQELSSLDLEISVLSPLKKIEDVNEIQIGKHGVLLKKGYYQGVFLPQVATEQGWDRTTFLNELCYKAGISDPDCWRDKDADLYIFSAEVFEEER
jgi:AmmeMemoRadiSam system protein B/AmmeMemoRadiSam system protein A